ncbi:hypothetical protein J1N35_031979 [Gossypium stocksii]|uniref:Rapid ALkalinization Factor n=1 Tax=Gossypium stocksii TaxID=47602 RepID=A0A9D3V2S2_9ROSI|nr:hypothetical protein J1N35_031979 [Gossypium stocksii]
MAMSMEKKIVALCICAMVVSSFLIGNATSTPTPTPIFEEEKHAVACSRGHCLPPPNPPSDRGCEASNRCRTTPP